MRRSKVWQHARPPRRTGPHGCRRRFQQGLIYFGLAEEVGEGSSREPKPESWPSLFLFPIGIVFLVGSHSTTAAGLISYVAFLPMLALSASGKLEWIDPRRALLRVEGQKERTQLANRAVTEGWSTRELENEARNGKTPAGPRRANQIDPKLTTAAQQLQDQLVEAGVPGWSIKPRTTGAVTSRSLSETSKPP